jgi:hypothetical protein
LLLLLLLLLVTVSHRCNSSVKIIQARSYAPGTRTALASIALALAAAACRNDPVAPQRPPYLAILSAYSSAPGVNPPDQVRFTVEELSGTLDIHRTLPARRGDTLIVPVPPASYVVEMLDLPPTCTVRDGPKRLITLLDSDNTGTLRFNVTCIPSLTIEVLMDGQELDTQLLYRVTGPQGERLGIVDLSGPDSLHVRGDTIALLGLPAGEHEVSVAQIAPNCIVAGEGPAERRIVLGAGGGQKVTFRLRCSEAARQPRILSFASTYHDATSAFAMRVVDPDRDAASYTWDLTDCHGNSLLPDHTPRVRKGLDVGRTQRADTLVILGAFEAGIADTLLIGGCTAIWIEDQQGNTSARIEQRIAAHRSGSAPTATTFNAVLRGTTSIGTSLLATDADGDFAGTFAAIRVRDGVLAGFDGNPDIGILSVAGYLDTIIPDIPLGTRVHWDDVYAVIVYLIDQAGNFTRLEDPNLSR